MFCFCLQLLLVLDVHQPFAANESRALLCLLIAVDFVVLEPDALLVDRWNRLLESRWIGGVVRDKKYHVRVTALIAALVLTDDIDACRHECSGCVVDLAAVADVGQASHQFLSENSVGSGVQLHHYLAPFVERALRLLVGLVVRREDRQMMSRWLAGSPARRK